MLTAMGTIQIKSPFTPKIDLVGIVTRRMEERGYNVAKLAAATRLTRQTLWSFLSNGKPINSTNLALIFDVLYLDVTPTAGAPAVEAFGASAPADREVAKPSSKRRKR